MTLRRAAQGLLALGALAVGVGCRKAPPAEETAPTASATAPAPAPVDHLGPTELIEGKEKAFGLVLPKALVTDGQFQDVVYARGLVPSNAVVDYVKARVRDGTVRTNLAGTIFENVRVPTTTRTLRIKVSPTPDGLGTTLDVRDITPPVDLAKTDEERWKAVGMKPNGELLDPKHMR